VTTTQDTTGTGAEAVGNWGRWGADDERGTLNLLTPDVVLAATRVPKTGTVYHLGLPIQREGVPIFEYRGAPQRLTLTSQTDSGMYDAYGAAPGVGANEDVLVLASHSITHMDALCHVFADHKHYNGYEAGSFASHTGAPRCGIEKTGGFAGRGVLLDIAALQGVDWVDPGYTITSADLEAARQAQDVEVRQGDILLVNTGWLRRFAQLPDQKDPGFEQPGLGYDACDFVLDHDIAALGADNAAIEVIPFDRNVFLGVHIELLVKAGITLMEHLRLEQMAADRCYESLFTVGPLLVTGATGSPINPIAIG
jgi:kynurenine formamidase